jgi:hypothetical protein
MQRRDRCIVIMLRHLAVILFALVGDLSGMRLLASIAVTGGAFALACWIAFPGVLPLELGLGALALGASFGLWWERAACRGRDRIR